MPGANQIGRGGVGSHKNTGAVTISITMVFTTGGGGVGIIIFIHDHNIAPSYKGRI